MTTIALNSKNYHVGNGNTLIQNGIESLIEKMPESMANFVVNESFVSKSERGQLFANNQAKSATRQANENERDERIYN